MRCSKTRELMSLSLDGEASPGQTREMEDHILCCDPCRRHWASLGTVSVFLRSAPMVRPDHDLGPLVMRRIEGLAPKGASRQSPLATYALLSILALYALAVGDLLPSATGWAVNLLDIHFITVADLVSTVWKLVSIHRLLGEAAWELVLHSPAFDQGTMFLAAIAVSLGLVALWAHLLKGYQGARVSRP